VKASLLNKKPFPGGEKAFKGNDLTEDLQGKPRQPFPTFNWPQTNPRDNFLDTRDKEWSRRD
jgi:hypothetical protein